MLANNIRKKLKIMWLSHRLYALTAINTFTGRLVLYYGDNVGCIIINLPKESVVIFENKCTLFLISDRILFMC
jgi:hypothetical protein